MATTTFAQHDKGDSLTYLIYELSQLEDIVMVAVLTLTSWDLFCVKPATLALY